MGLRGHTGHEAVVLHGNLTDHFNHGLRPAARHEVFNIELAKAKPDVPYMT